MALNFLPNYQLQRTRINNFSSPQPDQLVFKQGKTSGRTFGWVNALFETKLKGYKWVRKGIEHYPEYKYGWCQQIVDESHRHGVRYTQYDHLRNDRTQFSTKGDSRSAIFDIEGSFKGLLVGGVTLMDYSSFIPVEELFADICRLTGASEVRMLDLDILVSVLV